MGGGAGELLCVCIWVWVWLCVQAVVLCANLGGCSCCKVMCAFQQRLTKLQKVCPTVKESTVHYIGLRKFQMFGRICGALLITHHIPAARVCVCVWVWGVCIWVWVWLCVLGGVLCKSWVGACACAQAWVLGVELHSTQVHTFCLSVGVGLFTYTFNDRIFDKKETLQFKGTPYINGSVQPYKFMKHLQFRPNKWVCPTLPDIDISTHYSKSPSATCR